VTGWRRWLRLLGRVIAVAYPLALLLV